MIECIIKSIGNGIKNEFLNASIYTEKVSQGVVMPCFFVLCRGYCDEVFRGKRNRVRADIVIEFIAGNTTENMNSVINNSAERLYDITSVINTDNGRLRAIDRKCEKNERGLTFSVSYEYFYYRSDEDHDNGAVMEVLRQEGDVKNE